MTGVTVRILPMPNVKEAKVWKSSYANYKDSLICKAHIKFVKRCQNNIPTLGVSWVCWVS